VQCKILVILVTHVDVTHSAWTNIVGTCFLWIVPDRYPLACAISMKAMRPASKICGSGKPLWPAVRIREPTFRSGVEREMSQARQMRMGFDEVGGWAVAKSHRRTISQFGRAGNAGAGVYSRWLNAFTWF
jgi:hypothetical protein